ncbi:uncharacterized protein MELLADRAFT_124550 [Melampsora larici-populina 98AG31]|uniref:Secreted protein n=1 Tax=Melampsora larici-populina (strain 98AG31 / pathotype 3-4-7) TaxID=747676 RepID=F4RS51_MELLP|nr:uncharacterized protein MELLADRAFT_124550 [Melampsora larici-populina 98AG31]EGG04793.1 hypothetical protein MELLADRAFT_124550 [Melampsora larici-populina 98AG31]
MNLLFLILLCYPIVCSGHSFLLSIQGSDGVRSTAFGARLLTRGTLVQNTGIFDKDLPDEDNDTQSNKSRPGPCGRIFGGDSLPGFDIDVAKEMQIAEASGIPTASSNGTIQMGVYVANPDGAGPFKCVYSSDSSLKEFQPMKILHQVEGFKSVNKFANNFVYPLTATFNKDTTCSGGNDKNVCIIKCTNPNGFGSCAAVKLSSGFGHSNSTKESQLDSNPPLTSGASRGIRFG